MNLSAIGYKLTSAGALASLVACATPPPTLTPLEIQTMQTREFEASYDIAFASVISVFQDLGYIVEQASKDTGLITSNAPTQATRDWILTGMTFMQQVRATAFIEQIRPGMVRMRLNFVQSNQTSSAYGQDSRRDQAIMDIQLYRNAFERIDEAIFMRSGVGQGAQSNAPEPALRDPNQAAPDSNQSEGVIRRRY